MSGLYYVILLTILTVFIVRGIGYFQAVKLYFYSQAITILVGLVHKAQRYEIEGKNDLKSLERLLARFYPYVNGEQPLEELDRETLFNLTFASHPLNSKQEMILFLGKLPESLREVVNDMLNCIYAAYHTRSFPRFVCALLKLSAVKKSSGENTNYAPRTTLLSALRML